jgi:hypothetical protein
VVPKQFVCQTYNLLVDGAVLPRVLACGAAELLLDCVKAFVGVVLTLAALVLLGVGAGVHFDGRWEVVLVVGIWSR